MHLILTHEQADFDAIASQLGAYLLNEQAVPVLPQRLNRNVRAFLTIYGVELPFIERDDLPKETIDTVTLVDAQSMVSVKGMDKKTQVQVVDHHDLRPDLPADWNVTVQPTGATATILVEAIQELTKSLTPVQATLLLLGVYEDTGSLTYTRTTSRDLRAASYLLDEGASLNVAADYLNHPLSLPQQTLYDQLRQVAETHLIHGHNILIATGDAREMDEELSTIAHKLRDLLDPDGLFLLIRIGGGIQLISRSTSDNINVSKIAARFGGGGHPRAAAAMIKRKDLQSVHEELLHILPDFIKPAVTVAEIMSRGPQTLAPDTPVQEAAQHMQRFGYEGYPIVEGGALLGLLTRRVVDRAIGHNLNRTVHSLMEAGQVTVNPDDSVEHLQNVMTDTGWGQIPVIDPDTSEIVGIVTRTDVLKTLAPVPAVPGRRNLATRLEKFLSPIHLALLKAIAAIADEQHQALYIVGGFVRDLILDRPSLDFDLVVEGDAIILAKALAGRYGGRVTTHARFGTAKWVINEIHETLSNTLQGDEQLLAPTNNDTNTKKLSSELPALPDTIDLITARTEFYTYPTALPTVESSSIKLDLHRRDFTINTLALRLDGRHYGHLHDYWGGFNDLQHGNIRVLHSISFVDDPTRMLRAVRFEQRFDFQIARNTLELLVTALIPDPGEDQTLLDRVSGDRIRHELDRILEEPKAPAMLTRLDELGLLKAIHEAIPWDSWIENQIARIPDSSPPPEWALGETIKGVPLNRVLAYCLWFIRTPRMDVESVTKRLKIPVAVRTPTLAACKLWAELPKFNDISAPSMLTTWLDAYPPLSIYAVFLATASEGLEQDLHLYMTRWRHIRPTISGHKLRAIGLPPGPVYKEILETLRAAWLDGVVSTESQERTLFESLMQGHLK